MSKKINYNSRNFLDSRAELVNFVKQYYPDIFNDFNDSSVGMMLIELNAAISDTLSYHTDRMFQETQIDFAQERKSLLSMARTLGLKVPGKRPSITMVDFTVTVPVKGDTFDLKYAPIIKRGAQVSGAGKVFETTEDIDFTSPFTTGGIPNRLIIPNIDANQNIVSYRLVKREVVLNGISKVFKRVINPTDNVPFFELVLPENDVLSIESILTKEGTTHSKNPKPSDFFIEKEDPTKKLTRWYEVDALAESKIYVQDGSKSLTGGVTPGKWLDINNRFISEYTDKGFLKIIFGSGSVDTSSICDFGVNPELVNRIGDFINNNSLGSTLKSNQTLYVKYRVGGGTGANVGVGVINSVNIMNMFVNGPNQQVNNKVKNSLKINNPVPSLGGRDEPSIEEIRNLIRYNFSSQNRAVTIKDYQSRIGLMDGKFGVPFRYSVLEEQNKVVISLLSQNQNKKLTSRITNALKENIANYLSEYRMLNDYIEVKSGKVINLGIEVDLFIDKQYTQSTIVNEAITKIEEYFEISKYDMGDNIYMGELIEVINNINGVLNVIDVRIFNKVGGKYSVNKISQPYSDSETKQIDLLGEFTLFGEPTSMFEIKYPESDIKIRTK